MRLAVWIVVALTLLFIPLRIISYGFLPAGDVRRHVAKVFSDRPITEIVVMRPEYTMDHSPGWESLLCVTHRLTKWDQDGLVVFSVVVTMLLIFFAPLRWVCRPEAWLAALLAQMVALPELMVRLTQARPYLVTEAVLVAVLFSWSTNHTTVPRLRILLTVCGIAASVWIHGAWYLWLLPLTAFFLAGRWREGVLLSNCWILGSVMGALLTGKPIEFLKQALLISMAIAKEHVPHWVLVGEFRPSYGEFSTLVLVAVVFLLRRQVSKGVSSSLTGPVFWQIVICWIAGLKVDRCWADWGIPAVLVWVTLEMQEIMAITWRADSWRRLTISGLVAIPLFLTSTNDLDRRYTTPEIFLDAESRLQGWLPENGGIFYSANMGFFYNTFYKNPKANWRYILGMEPALMPEDDLRILRNIQLKQYAFEAYMPWIGKMRPSDRLAILCDSQPNLPELEWTHASGSIWIGRLPKKR